MTDISFDFAPARRPSGLRGTLLGSLLAVLATLGALSLLPEPRSGGADPTQVEIWRGNAAQFPSGS